MPAPSNIPDRDGTTPLAHARQRGYAEIAARIEAGPRRVKRWPGPLRNLRHCRQSQPFNLHNRRDNERAISRRIRDAPSRHRAVCSRPSCWSLALLAPFGIASAEEGGTLGDLFRELLARRRIRRPRLRRSRRTGAAPAPAAIDSKRVPFGRAEMELSFAPLVKNTAPAVVNVYASQKVAARSPFAGDPFFEQFFGDQQMPPRVQQSLGSGVLVDPSRHRRHQFPRHPRCRHGQGRDRRTAANSPARCCSRTSRSTSPCSRSTRRSRFR